MLRETIEFLQQELFDLGAELATPRQDRYPGMWVVQKSHVEVLEKLCDYFGEELPELSSFILPGGSKAAAALHQARVVARRAERAVLRLKERETQGVSPELVCYVNRLSDLFFILARWTLGQER